MKRLLLALLPWTVIATAAAQELPRPAQVFFTHYGKLSAPAYQIGTECFVPLDAVQTWGWKATADDRQAEITANGKKFKLAYRNQSGNKIIPLSPVLSKLGAEAGWVEGTGNFVVLGKIKSFAFNEGKLKLESTLKVLPKVTYLQNPDRLIIDFIGARLSPDAEVKIDEEARVGQYKQDIVRFVINTSDRPVNPNLNIDPTTVYAVDLSSSKRSPGAGPDDLNVPTTIIPVTQQNPPPTTNANTNAGGTTNSEQATLPTLLDNFTAPANLAPTVVAGPLRLVTEKPTNVKLSLTLNGALTKAAMFKRVDPETLEIYLPNTKHSSDEAPKIESKHVAGVEIEQTPEMATIRLKLEKPMGIELTTVGREINIILIQPENANGRLAGKVIVVDPGHGGHDSGAKSPGKDTFEKQINLKVATELARQLTAQGATVILTRKTDVFIDLKERPAIANRNGADLFVSVHVNSNKKANSTSGSIVFYHNSSALGTLLADCINVEMGKAKTGIPTIGTWSDTRIYDSGFAVLRYAEMPAVLIELGFINHSKDRASLKADEFPVLVSRAVVKGIKVYFGDEKEN